MPDGSDRAFCDYAIRRAQRAVVTYHYDTLRTGWNRSETALSAASFPATFGVLTTVSLDDQVDAQPLLVPAVHIAGGIHDVLYVVTESNSVYALDGAAARSCCKRIWVIRCRRRWAAAIMDPMWVLPAHR